MNDVSFWLWHITHIFSMFFAMISTHHGSMNTVTLLHWPCRRLRSHGSWSIGAASRSRDGAPREHGPL